MDELFKLVVIVVGVVFWVVALLAQILMILNRREDVSWFQASLMYFPLVMELSSKQYLTERGMCWRRLSWISLVSFSIIVLVALWRYG